MQPRKTVAPRLRPTLDQTFEIEGSGPWNFLHALHNAYALQERGEVEEACEERYRAVQRLLDLLPEEEPIALEWNHANTQAALEVLYLSMIDHFLIGDFELSAALGESLLECDEEDHFGATLHLAFNYLALKEFDSFEELLPDLSEKDPERPLLELWASWLQHKELDKGALQRFKGRFNPYFEEFCRTTHPADESYLSAMASAHPSPAMRARDLWLKTEHLWQQHPDFIEALRQ